MVLSQPIFNNNAEQIGQTNVTAAVAKSQIKTIDAEWQKLTIASP